MRHLPTHPQFWIKAACKAFCIPEDELLAVTVSGGPKEIRRMRQATMWVARNMTDYSYPELAFAFRKEDHTTVLHAVQRAEKDDWIIPLIEEIFEYVESGEE